MDEDYQASNDRDADEWYDQDGPDLFGMDADELRGTVLALARIITGTAPEADTLTG